MGESSSAARDGDTSQMPWAGLEEAAECSQHPICLGSMEDAAYVAFCMHQFCFAHIKKWAQKQSYVPTLQAAFLLTPALGANG